LGLEKEIFLFLRLSPKFFSGYSYSRTVAYHEYLASNKKGFNLRNAYQKSNRQTSFIYSEKQNNWQTLVAQKFRLTPPWRAVRQPALMCSPPARRKFRFINWKHNFLARLPFFKCYP